MTRSPDAGGSDEAGAGASDAPGVELSEVRVSFGTEAAVDGVSLAVERGEFFTLVGPSGCGKTTTLRAIAGFEDPDEGRVAIDGRDVRGVPPEDRDTGIVFQNYALFPHMTVRENVAYGLRFRDPPGGVSDGERVEQLLELVDLEGMGDRDPTALSGGQQQRVALARALAPGPEVLLLDEPLSALDARLRERLRLTVREIQRELDITTVYVTHDQAEALAISDRVAVMRDGRIEQVGRPETVYRKPASRFVAEFVGDDNVFEGEVTATDPPAASVDGRSIRLPASAPGRVGDVVTICLRPGVVRFGPGDTTLEATVESVEFLGDAYVAHCDWNGRAIRVRTDATGGESAPPVAGDDPAGETVELGFDAADLHVLDDGPGAT